MIHTRERARAKATRDEKSEGAGAEIVPAVGGGVHVLLQRRTLRACLSVLSSAQLIFLFFSFSSSVGHLNVGLSEEPIDVFLTIIVGR